MNVGIVGQGFVGSAVREGLKSFHKVRTYDIKHELRDCDSLAALVRKSEIMFVCLPTPMRKNGSCDAKLLHGAVGDIDDIAANEESTTKKVVVVKSTVPPGTTERLDADNLHIDVVYSPEFLTEANSFDDFKNQSRIILGGSRPATTMVKTMLRRAFPQTPIIKTGSKTAEMVKYFTNSFLATKVIFANEIYDVCRALEIDYDKVTEYALYDSRIGKSHLAVPGPDGDRGFGGHCFPKDVEALVHFAEAIHVDPALLKVVLSINNKIRSDRNWEKMYGRAVSDE